MVDEPSANYFVEIHDDLYTNTHYRHPDLELEDVNDQFRKNSQKKRPQKIGVVFMGRQAPGGQNVIDGLLRYQAQRNDVELIGFINGVTGLLNNDYEVMSQGTFANHVNLGGPDSLHAEQEKAKALEVVNGLKLTGLVIVGATNAMTDGLYLAEYFKTNDASCSVIVVPASVDGDL